MTTHYVSSNVTYTSENNVFYKNGMALTNQNGRQIDDASFELLIKKEISSFIHRTFNNIIVLVGAGASVLCTSGNIDPRFGKTVFMLAKLINEELKRDSNLFTLQELADLCKYDIRVESAGQNAVAVLNPAFSLEDFLSNMLSFEKYVSAKDQAKYASSKDKIFGLIVSNTSYDYDGKCLKHAAFINTVSRLVKTPSKLTIVTTNYDTLIEDAADSIDYTVMDGFSFSYRPHFDSDMFEWNLVKDVENIKTREHEYKKNIINLLKLHGSLTWEREECNEPEKRRIYRKDKRDVVKPIMIFPSSNKYRMSYEEPYFELFAKFQELLKRSNTLLITTGFGFGDDHISQMITQAILHNKSMAVLVSDYDIDQNTDNWRKLVDLMKKNYQIVFLRETMNSKLTDYLGEYNDD